MRTSSLLLLGPVIELSAIIVPAAATLSESGCFAPHHCLQFRSGGLCFFPNPNSPTPLSCNDEGLKRAMDNHVASENHTPSNAYWDLASGAFLGDVHTPGRLASRTLPYWLHAQ